ncbi:MAG: hypothetical protein LBI60_02820 [Bacteroidales bacterium]|jgi:hypothetical protein|nr:hypothetical protein [Bacteroidales bacterium]
MKQYFKQTQQHADYGAGVMETGDHSINGASLKSLTSRRNFLLIPDAGDRSKTKSIMNGTMKFLSMALIVALTMFSLSGCSEDDDEDYGDVTGRWLFRESNILFYLNKQVYNLKEEEGTNTALLQGLNSAFGESFFIFADGTLTVVKEGQSDDIWGDYTVSGDKIIMNDGATTFTVRYRISGNSLDLTFNRSAFEAILGTLPDDYYTFDEVEFILSFNRAN